MNDETTHLKFGRQIVCQVPATDCKLPPKGAWPKSHDPILKIEHHSIALEQRRYALQILQVDRL